MISFVLRSFIWFSASFLILSIPIQEKPLFGHLSDVFGPTAKGILGDFSKRATETVKVGKEALNKLFQTTPGVSDRLEIKQSARQKEEEPADDYTVEEREMLKSIFNQKE